MKVDKTLLLNSIVEERVGDLEEIYKDFVEQKVALHQAGRV
jgi:hypothetical protein